MKKYALLAVAILCLTTLSRAEDRIEAPAPSQGALERSAAPYLKISLVALERTPGAAISAPTNVNPRMPHCPDVAI
jgi:hypothetical protein